MRPISLPSENINEESESESDDEIDEAAPTCSNEAIKFHLDLDNSVCNEENNDTESLKDRI